MPRAVGSGIAVSVIDNAEEHRFELRVEGQLAHLDYRCSGGRLVLVHTEVPEALSGRGLGGELVEAALEVAISRGLSVVPACSFASSFLRKHPELASRVKIQWPQD
ncbi:MAG: GNAT family N-acetyltransferase [Acidimicrobiales bacterium]|jgi:predicted GNAT family acetyltransferase